MLPRRRAHQPGAASSLRPLKPPEAYKTCLDGRSAGRADNIR